jgi:antitoxin VapB
MPRTKLVRLFKNGASQAVRLPAEFRFSGDTVYATQNESTGDVVLSTRPGTKHWEDFFGRLRAIKAEPDFMVKRPMNRIPEEKDVFGKFPDSEGRSDRGRSSHSRSSQGRSSQGGKPQRTGKG